MTDKIPITLSKAIPAVPKPKEQEKEEVLIVPQYHEPQHGYNEKETVDVVGKTKSLSGTLSNIMFWTGVATACVGTFYVTKKVIHFIYPNKETIEVKMSEEEAAAFVDELSK